MDNISTPTLLLDEQVCRTNISRMVRKAEKHQLDFKPHMKTHQSAAIGEWLREEGVQSITVSSVSMARYFVDHNWEDRSEEHTSELQSRFDLVCRLLL